MGCGASTEAHVKKNATSGFTARMGPDPIQQARTATQNTEDEATTTTTGRVGGGGGQRSSSGDNDEDDDPTQMILNQDSRVTETQTIYLGSLKVRYASVSKKGRDPDVLHKPNQDSYSHHCSFTCDENALFGVYDGHGPTGQECSKFVRLQLPQMIKSHLDDQYPPLTANIIQDSLREAHLQCNRSLHQNSDIDDSYSGTTSVTLFLQPHRVTISNVGDSRAILGTLVQQGNDDDSNNHPKMVAVPLSKDQTPRRREEAHRCQQAGARILSVGQINNEIEDGDDDVEDPPRVWAPDGKYPGTAFTRSLGDRIAKKYGVCAEPEVLPLTLSDKEKILVIASDGIFDVLSNQQVIDICVQEQDPFQACEAIVRKSHLEWLKHDFCENEDDPAASYDDMTVLVIMLGDDLMIPVLPADKHEEKEKEDDSKATIATTSSSERTATTDDTTNTVPKKRVRQKTLRKIEDGPQPDSFFSSTTTNVADTPT